MKRKATCRCVVLLAIIAFVCSAASSGMEDLSLRGNTVPFPGPLNTINLKTTVLNTEAHPLRRTW
jgi:hypothetical protein